MHLIDLNPGIVCSYVKKHRDSLKNPVFSVERYLDKLERQSLLNTVRYLKDYQEII